MTQEQIRIDDATMSLDDKTMLALYEDSTTWTISPQLYQRDIELTRWCINHVPQPPAPYGFSSRQKFEQYEFFRHQSDIYIKRFLNLYNAAIIIACTKNFLVIYSSSFLFFFFLVPDNASESLRQIVETLLTIYTEPKLNTMECDISTTNTERYWFQTLVHPRFLTLEKK